MKKLGIITFNRALNYGAALQAYALKSICDDLGYETRIIDYNKDSDKVSRPFDCFRHSPKTIGSLIQLLKNYLSYHWDKKRWKSFKIFRNKYLNESPTCKTSSQIAALNYDVYLMGSDQIWNYNITGGTFDPVYFGRLSQDSFSIVYGASSHDTPFPLGMELSLKDELSKTTAPIGIREQKLADYVGEVTGIKYPVVLDPTLLAGQSVLKKIESPWVPRKPYILIYQIDHNPLSDISIRSLEKKFGCKVFSMTVPKLGSLHGKKGFYGPEQFLAFIHHAEFVVTNSFHGIAISLLWHKQFYVYENGGVMTRIDDLLGSLNLLDRKVRLVSDIDIHQKIDYSLIDPILEKKRKDSLQFLENALSGNRQLMRYDNVKRVRKQSFADRKKENCSGCTACVEICPVGAIQMKSDREGFLYPGVNQALCIHCGACDTFCSFDSSLRSNKELPKAFGVKHKRLETRITSRSGAAFIAISDAILKKDGVIYGAALEKRGLVYHIRAESVEQRDQMKGAKYVQSNMTGILGQVIRDLNAGRHVLFSGTPCQVAGLKALLEHKKVETDRLLTCDLICHGVPSPMVWKDYLSYIENKYNARILKADFRDKTFGWDTHCESFQLDNGRKVVSRDYTDLFYEHLMFRPSCHNCQFANINRIGDITLGDFWGIEKNDPSFDDSKGVSLVLINSEKGNKAFLEASRDLDYFECDVCNCIQPTLVKPSAPSPRREMFWKSYQARGFEPTMKKYGRPVSAAGRLKKDAKQLLYRIGLRAHP